MLNEKHNEERDTLLEYLNERKENLRNGLKHVTDTDLKNVMKGQLDTYMNVIAFIMSDGKLR